MRHFVYWRVAAEHAERAVCEVRAVHERLGVQAEVWRRPEVRDGRVTVMEVYDADAGSTLEPAATAALAGLLDGARHVERFDRLA